MVVQSTGAATSRGGIDFNDEETLYQLALMQGGSIADSAEHLHNPATGMLSTAGNSIKNSAMWLLEQANKPLNIIAGTISSKYTAGEAIQLGLYPSDVLYGEKDYVDAPGFKGAIEGVFSHPLKSAGRFATDVMLDPLTYFPLGKVASLGKGSLSKVSVDFSRELAERDLRDKALEIGLKGTDVDNFVSSKLSEFDGINNVTMNQLGQDLLNKRAMMSETAELRDFYKTEGIKLINEGKALNIDEAIKQAKSNPDILAKRLTERDIWARKWADAGIDMKTNFDYASEAMGRLLSRHPALLETYMDKGGIKLFQRTILSSARLNKAIDMIPGMKTVDTLTKPVRGIVDRAFNRRSGDDYLTNAEEILNKASDKKATFEQIRNQAIFNASKKFNLTRTQAEFITAAVEHEIRPTDQTLNQVYQEMLGLAETPKFIPENVTNAIREYMRIDKRNLRAAQLLGTPLKYVKGHAHHPLTFTKLEEKKKFTSASTGKLGAQAHAELARFDEIRSGNNILYGNPKVLELQRYYPKVAIKALNSTLEKMDKTYGLKVEKLLNDIVSVQSTIQTKFANLVGDDFEKLLKTNVPEAQYDEVKSAIAVLKERLPHLNFNKMKELHIKAQKDAEDMLANITKGSTPKALKEIDKLTEQIKDLPDRIEDVSGKINTALVNRNRKLLEVDDEVIDKTLAKEGLDDETKNILKQLKEVKAERTKARIDAGLNEEELSEYMDSLVTQFEQNRTGVKHLMNSLVGKDSKMANLLEELSDKRLALMKQIDETGQLQILDGDLWRSKQGQLFRESRATMRELEEAGFKDFDQNGFTGIVRASRDITRHTIMKDALDGISEMYGIPKSQAPESWLPLKIGKYDSQETVNFSNWLSGKKGEELVFDPRVVNLVENTLESVGKIDDDIAPLLKSYDKLNRFFKAWSTSIFPQFHGVNAIGNVFNSMMNLGSFMLNPVNHVMSINILKSAYRLDKLETMIKLGDSKALQEWNQLSTKVFFTDKSGRDWTVNELRHTMRTQRVAFGNQFAGHIDIEARTPKDVDDEFNYHLFDDQLTSGQVKLKKIGDKWTKVDPLKLGMDVGQMIEDQGRIMHFLGSLRETGDVVNAAQRTKQFLFDYNNLSAFEKKFLRRIIPFYTWQRKNLELHARQLLTNPLSELQVAHVAQTLSNSLSGDTGLTKEEVDSLPHWMKNKFRAVEARNGDTVYIIESLKTPQEGFLDALKTKTWLNSVTPYAKYPVELITGYSTFRERDIDPRDDAHLLENAPKAVKDLFGYVSYEYTDDKGEKHRIHSALNAKAYYAFLNLPIASRAIKGAMETNNTEDGNMLVNILNVYNTKEINLTALEKQQQKDRVRELQSILEDAGIMYKFEKAVKSKNTQLIEN